jgi:FKBP-type peptidyl-prolyl cis-trans isomerase 2
MNIVKEGIKVCIIFEAKLESGEIAIKTEEDHPLEITIGEGTIPISIEEALINMNEGDTKTIKLEPKEAFGPRLDELIIELPREGFNKDANLEVGSKVCVNSSEGKKFWDNNGI